MAGIFPGVSGAQQNDNDGAPMRGALLYVFSGGTTVLANTYQDIGLSISAQNPLTADDSGRIPLFYVADGTYRVRLLDQYGSVANGGFDYPQVPSIGASSSGGGGTSVDPTTIAATGDVKFQFIQGLISGWVRLNGRTIGSSTSGASERAAADTQSLFIYLWTNFSDTICPISGGVRGASALADFSANKTITLLDMRGRMPVGLDDMGNAAKSAFVGVTVTPDALTAGGYGGETTHTLLDAELPSHTHTATVTDAGHTHVMTSDAPIFSSQGAAGGGARLTAGTATITAASATTGVTVANADTGSDQPHVNMQPFMLGSFYMKL